MHPHAHRSVTRGLTQYSPLFLPCSSLILVGGCSAFPYLKVQLTVGCRRQGTAGGAGRGWQGGSELQWLVSFKEVSLHVWFPPSEYFSCFYSNFCGRKIPFPRFVWTSWVLSLTHLCCRHGGFGKITPTKEWLRFLNSLAWSVLLCQAWQSLLCLWEVPAGTSPKGMGQMPKCSFSVSVKQNMTRQEKFSCP